MLQSISQGPQFTVRSVWQLASLLILTSILSDSAHGSDPRTGDQLVQRAHKTMGTLVSITVWTNQPEVAVRAIAKSFYEFDRIDKKMTTWLDDSEVSQINSAAGQSNPIKVSEETFQLLVRAVWGAEKTRGAFDITVGAFRGVWKFDHDKDGLLPEAKKVSARKALVGWRDLALSTKDRTARLLRTGQRITLGGIAKGLATDRAVSVLRKAGLVDFIVQAGGDMYVAGQKGDRLWRVGIRDPRDHNRGDFFAFAQVSDRTFSTSGDYERFVIKDGKRYHHILDPRTGYPASRCRSVTVMASDAVTADILSTGLFVMGAQKGMALVERMKGVDAVFVDRHNKVHVSSGLKGKLQIVKPPSDGI